jgi:hypothetical protein
MLNCAARTVQYHMAAGSIAAQGGLLRSPGKVESDPTFLEGLS